MTDERTNGQTFVNVESLSRLKIFVLHYFITDWQVWIHLPDPDCMDSAVEPVHVGVGHHVHHVVHQSLLQSHGLDVPA